MAGWIIGGAVVVALALIALLSGRPTSTRSSPVARDRQTNYSIIESHAHGSQFHGPFGP